ncbi:type VII secretion protein EccB [Actinopolymorpha pittospori]
MQTRRDQLQAYRYLVRRVLAAMLGSDPEAIEQPMRRVTASTFAGVMVGAVACAGVALYAWLADSNSSKWKNEAATSLIVEKETGALYVYRDKSLLDPTTSNQPPPVPGQGSDKNMLLMPIRNATSAMLLMGSGMTKVSVGRDSLAGIPRGPEIGIAKAPNAVPLKESLVSAPWAMCATAHVIDEETKPEVDLLIGTKEDTVGGRNVGERGLLVQGPDKRYYLVWHGKRLATEPRALASIDLSASSAIQVSEEWLRALPAGQDLAGPTVEGRKKPGPVTLDDTAETTIGEVFHVSDPDRFYLMNHDGFAEITEVQARILVGTGVAFSNGQPQTSRTEVGLSTVLAHLSADHDGDLRVADLPAKTPALVSLPSPDTPLCLWYDNNPAGDKAQQHLTTGGTLPPSVDIDAGRGSRPRIVVPPGGGALAALLPAPGVAPSGYYLITESGEKFPVPNKETLALLGYDGVDPLPVPPPLLNLIPTGPALSSQAASHADQLTAASTTTGN